MPDAQELADRWYVKHGPCCAGCDWWHQHNSIVGECHRSAPVPAEQRVGMLGVHCTTYPLTAGHVMTPRNHHCGDFKDDFDWSTLLSRDYTGHINIMAGHGDPDYMLKNGRSVRHVDLREKAPRKNKAANA